MTLDDLRKLQSAAINGVEVFDTLAFDEYRQQLLRSAPALLACAEALKKAQEHLTLMRECWRSGEVTSCNGRSGSLSNACVDAEVAAREALRRLEGVE